ncbi:MAG: hypothetical protein QW786_02865, partial [Candidatus Hadarchaeum sp.]
MVVLRYWINLSLAFEFRDALAAAVLVHEQNQPLPDELQEVFGRGREAERKIDGCAEANLELIVYYRSYFGDVGYLEMIQV